MTPRAQSEISQWFPGNSLPVYAARRERAALVPVLGQRQDRHRVGQWLHCTYASAQNLPPWSLVSSCCLQTARDGLNSFPRLWAQGAISATFYKAGLSELPGHQHCMTRSPHAST